MIVEWSGMFFDLSIEVMWVFSVVCAFLNLYYICIYLWQIYDHMVVLLVTVLVQNCTALIHVFKILFRFVVVES